MHRSYKTYRDYYEDDAQAPDGAFDLENSIWRNTKFSGELSKKYISYVKEIFRLTDRTRYRKLVPMVHRAWKYGFTCLF